MCLERRESFAETLMPAGPAKYSRTFSGLVVEPDATRLSLAGQDCAEASQLRHRNTARLTFVTLCAGLTETTGAFSRHAVVSWSLAFAVVLGTVGWLRAIQKPPAKPRHAAANVFEPRGTEQRVTRE
jgi:hypothetical protein